MSSLVTGNALAAKFPAYIEYRHDGKVCKVAGSTAKFVAVIMADSCNPDGKSACRGISSICEMTGYTRPTVISALRALVAIGVLKLRGVNTFYRTNSYDVNVARLVEMAEVTGDAELVGDGKVDGKMNGKMNGKVDGKATLLNPLTDTHYPITTAAEETARPNIFTIYEQNIGPLTPLIGERLADLEASVPATWPAEWFTVAATKAVSAGVRRLDYIEAIVKSWQRSGYNVDTRPAKVPQRGNGRRDRRDLLAELEAA